ncbi:hypothetical protein ACFL9S_12490 [Erwinia sp. AnSW2-5]|uniref:hypothetical protein n=1 Tax=Erwinia sp. AnSW2-5 TaxID=3367692 RepID=UPI003858408C
MDIEPGICYSNPTDAIDGSGDEFNETARFEVSVDDADTFLCAHEAENEIDGDG